MKHYHLVLGIIFTANIFITCSQKQKNAKPNEGKEIIDSLINFLNKDSINLELIYIDSTKESYKWYTQSVEYCLLGTSEYKSFGNLIENGFVRGLSGKIYKKDGLASYISIWEFNSVKSAIEIYNIYIKHLRFCNSKKMFVAMFQKGNLIFFTDYDKEIETMRYDEINREFSKFFRRSK